MGKNTENQPFRGPSLASPISKRAALKKLAFLIGWTATSVLAQNGPTIANNNIPGNGVASIWTATNTMGSSKTLYQKQFDELKNLIVNPEIDTIMPGFWWKLWVLIQDMEGREAQVEPEQIQLISPCYNQILSALTKLQKDCNASFLAEKDTKQRELRRIEHVAISADISLIQKLPADYKASLAFPVSQRTISPGYVLNTLWKIASKHNLKAASWQPIRVDAATSTIARQAAEVRALWVGLENTLVAKQAQDITFKGNPQVVAAAVILKSFMVEGASSPQEVSDKGKDDQKNYVEGFFIGKKTNWKPTVKGIDAVVSNTENNAAIGWTKISPGGTLILAFDADIPKPKLPKTERIIFSFKFEWSEEAQTFTRIKLRTDDGKEITGWAKGDGTFEVVLDGNSFPKKGWKLQATCSFYSKDGAAGKQTVILSQPKLILIPKDKI